MINIILLIDCTLTLQGLIKAISVFSFVVFVANGVIGSRLVLIGEIQLTYLIGYRKMGQNAIHIGSL